MDSGSLVIDMPAAPVVHIQPNDILAISVTSVSSLQMGADPVSIYREGGVVQSVVETRVSVGGGGQALMTPGFLVDEEGNISFPVVGKVQVGAQTIQQVKTQLSSLLSSYVKSPVVDVRITNFKVSVVGEVSSPGAVLAANQRITVLEAIAAAGDIRIGGRKDNVMVVRQQNGRKEIGYIDLTKKTAFNSPYFYLKQNDIVNVSPAVVRQQEVNVFTRVYLPTITTVISAALAAYALVQITRK